MSYASREEDGMDTPRAEDVDVVLEGLSGGIVLEGLVRDRVQAALNPLFATMGELAKKTSNPTKTRLHLLVAVLRAALSICEEQTSRARDAVFNTARNRAFSGVRVDADATRNLAAKQERNKPE